MSADLLAAPVRGAAARWTGACADVVLLGRGDADGVSRLPAGPGAGVLPG
ncbi:hypothetical protein ACWHAO_22905 [Streptomyces albidoflavus]